MNQNQTAGQECLSLFITYDPFGVPERVDCHRVAVEGHTALDAAFMNYLTEERNAVLRGETFPDLRVCRYDMDAERVDESRFKKLSNDARALEAFIGAHAPEPLYDFSLRKFDALSYAFERVGDSYDLETLKAYTDPDTTLRDGVKEDMDQYMEYLREVNESSLSRRLNAIETAQGVLLFPDTANVKLKEKMFLQYVADRFFTPEARQIGYVRMYPLERPTEEQTRIAARSGYMFSLRDKTFLPEKAIWNLPIVLPEKETPGCTYPLRPTYDAFRYFIQDNDLTVSAENDQVFNLVFIAEMGCPAHFQTDEQYDRFIHRADFLALDDRLEKARRENPSNETLFYRIQNRQQILARDILRGKYNIEIPELKLTGPPAPERQRHRENVRVKPSKNPKPGLK